MRRAILLILALFTMVWTCGHSSSGYYYYYFDERIDLTADPTTIAALTEAGVDPKGLSDLLADAGYLGAGLQQYPVQNWWLVELRSASDPPVIEGVASVIANLIGLDSPSRYFFSPLFVNPGGERLIVTPSIVARFAADLTDQRIDALLALAGAPGADTEPFGGIGNTFRITNQFRSGIDVLNVANCLAGFSEVVYSEPAVILSGEGAGGPPADEPRGIPALTPTGLVILSLTVVLSALRIRRRTWPVRPGVARWYN